MLLQCFGLLGLNGAGKTTAFRMLTGDVTPSGGDAFVSGRSVCKRGLVPGSIGYCPQVDAVSGALTGREHLILFCMLRGMSLSQLKRTVEQTLCALELSQYADKPVRTYSGGNRRRLSTAISLLANPPVVMLVRVSPGGPLPFLSSLPSSFTHSSFLFPPLPLFLLSLTCPVLLSLQDEPTSGVDPRARQFLWHIVQEMVGRGQTVLLTTHSMAECEALCSRVGILVNGSLLCLGSPQQLKSRYGQGYRLKVRVGSADVEQTKEIVRQKFLGAILKVCSAGVRLPISSYSSYTGGALQLPGISASCWSATGWGVCHHGAGEAGAGH